jgi:uncharacterized phage-associated protein
MPSFALVSANDFIKRASEENVYLPRTKLLKLLYFLFGHYYAKNDTPLFEEKFQAWQYGPVLTKVYNKTKKLNQIDALLQDSDGKSYTTNIDSEYGQRYFEIFDYVWEKYKNLSSVSLTRLSHAPGSPWEVTKKKYGEYAEIDNELIKKYFSGEAIA